jgi:CBS domain-containing protein
MRRTRSDAVPVVTETGQLAGLITATDLVADIADDAVQAGQDGRPARRPAGPR